MGAHVQLSPYSVPRHHAQKGLRKAPERGPAARRPRCQRTRGEAPTARARAAARAGTAGARAEGGAQASGPLPRPRQARCPHTRQADGAPRTGPMALVSTALGTPWRVKGRGRVRRAVKQNPRGAPGLAPGIWQGR